MFLSLYNMALVPKHGSRMVKCSGTILPPNAGFETLLSEFKRFRIEPSAHGRETRSCSRVPRSLWRCERVGLRRCSACRELPKSDCVGGPSASASAIAKPRTRMLAQERLAYEAEVDRSYVGGLERDEENPTVDVLDRLANTLQVSISELFRPPRRGAAPPKPLRAGRRSRR